MPIIRKFACRHRRPLSFAFDRILISTTSTQAKQRQTILEQAVSEAQHSEGRLSQFQNWLQRIDDALNDHLENDTTVDDLPHDFQVVAICINEQNSEFKIP